MRVLNNPILGMIFNRYSLVLNNEGLHRKIHIDGMPEQTFFLTDDVRKIAELVGLDFDEFDQAREDDKAFPLITKCSGFIIGLFLNRNESGSTTLDAFYNYVDNTDLEENTPVPINTERVEEVLGIKILDKINEYKFVMSNYNLHRNPKFNGMKAKLIENGYAPQNFSKDLPVFNDSFSSEYDYWKFFVMQDVDIIYERYVCVTCTVL
jgi:hypothetical protein